VPLDARTVEAIAALLAERHVLFFRDQLLDSAGQCAFAAQFGTLADHFPAHRRVRRCTTKGSRPLAFQPEK